MDFFSMKRKKLQSLCKKHGIPANIKSTEMAEKLSAIYEGNENADAGTDREKDVRMEDSDTVAGKDTDGTLNQMDASPSGTAGGNVDACQVKSVSSSQKMSGDQEESTMKSPLPERRDDIGFLNVEENSQMSFDAEQVDDNKELHLEAPTADVDSQEFGNNIVDGEVEEVSGETDVLEDNHGIESFGDEAEKQDPSNSPQGKESGCCLGEGEVNKLDDSICVHGAVYNDSNISEASKMCLDASIGTKDADGKTNAADKSCFEDSDWTPVHKRVVPGTATKSEDTCGAKFELASEEMQIDDRTLCDVKEHKGIVMKDVEDVQVALEDTQVGDTKLCDAEENVQTSVNKEEADESQEVLKVDDRAHFDVEEKMQVGVQVDAEELANDFVAVEAEQLDDTIDLVEDVFGSAKGKDEAIKQGSNINDSNNIFEAATMCHDASMGAKVTDGKTNAIVEHILDEVYSSNFEDSDETSLQFPPTDPFSEVKSGDLDVPKMVIPDTCRGEFDDIGLFDDEENNVAEGEIERLNDIIGIFEDVCGAVKDRNETVKQVGIDTPQGSNISPGEVQKFGDNILDAIDAVTCEDMLKSSQKTGLEAEQEECIGFSDNGLECSANKGFAAEMYFDPIESVVGFFNMKEGTLVEGEDSRLFDNSDAHDETGGMSHKRKWNDVDNTNDQNSDEKEKADEFAQTMSKPGEMDSCNVNLHQTFASGNVSGDEGTDQVELESSPKGTPIASSKKSIIFSPKVLESSRNIGTCEMKGNIKFDKNEQVGSTISKNKFGKRTPLQDLQQQ